MEVRYCGYYIMIVVFLMYKYNPIIIIIAENGLRSAELATSALYHQSLDALSQLSAEELQKLFGETARGELQLNADSTILQLAMKAHCFPTES
jgi:tyrosyl-tRNA synthetase